MKISSISAMVITLLAGSQAHAQVERHATSIQVGSAILFGQEFSLNFCPAIAPADVQCMSNWGGPSQCPNWQSTSCDTGVAVNCTAEHYLRLRIPDSEYFTGWLPGTVRYRINFPDGGWINEVNYVHCNANGVHDYTLWNDQISIPKTAYYERSPEVVVAGFAAHVRPAFARGTVIMDTPLPSQWNSDPLITLTLEQSISNVWSPVAEVTRSYGGPSTLYEVTGYVDPSASVRVRAKLLTYGTLIRLRDVRLFVEQCFPDASRPGKCLGDP